jgi:hypothetical protein
MSTRRKMYAHTIIGALAGRAEICSDSAGRASWRALGLRNRDEAALWVGPMQPRQRMLDGSKCAGARLLFKRRSRDSFKGHKCTRGHSSLSEIS